MTTNLVQWLREMASGPMCHNSEHIETCNNLTACADKLEQLEAKALPEECHDCRYCVDRTDHIPGCDNPIGATEAKGKEPCPDTN